MIAAETVIPAEVLARLAERASTLEERLAFPFVTDAENRASQIQSRISRWAELGAKNDRERLQRSLQWRGIDLSEIAPALGDVSLSPGAALPEWVLHFDALVEAVLTTHRPEHDEPLPANERVAVMTPFLHAAASQLRWEIPAHVRPYVADGALDALERNLLLRLTRLAGPVLAGEYFAYAYRDSRAGGDPETRAQRFADRVLQPPLPQFFVEYPVLARLVTLACDNWKAASLELLGRLAVDRQAIVEQFHEGRDPGPLVDIQVGDADVHDGHREVVSLVFEDGFRIVYKPRSMDLDQAVYGLFHWLNERGLSPSLRSPGVLCRDGYGWAEFILHRPAEGAEELALFYERAGVFACAAYLMGATDLHYGNLIAQDGYPIAVDLETMLKADPRLGALPMPAAAGQIANLGLHRSVLQSMFLPLIQRLPTGHFVDMSALGAEPRGDVAEQDGHWLPVRTLSLKQVLRDHASRIEKGFVSAYRFIASQQQALLAEESPLAAFKDCTIRVVLRDTSLYFRLLRDSIDPSVLRDSIDRMISLERLNHVISICDSTPSFADMVSHELTALMRLDVPRFLVMTEETDLRDAEGLVAANVMQRTPLAEVRLRLESMSEADLQQQCKDIRLSLHSHFATQPGSRSLSSQPAPELPDAAMLITAAERLGDELLAEAESCGDLPPTWRGLVYISAARRFTAGDAEAAFADGGLGIAAFFAALFRATDDQKWRTAALDLSRKYFASMTSTAAYNGHIAGGMTAGLGGVLYGAALMAALLDNDETLENGLVLANLHARRAVIEEREMSLGDGLAGTLLGVASLRELAPKAFLNDVLEQGAARLRDGKPLSTPGLLSGQAGVALAANAIGLGGSFSAPMTSITAATEIDWAEGEIGWALAALKADPDAIAALDCLARIHSAPMAGDDSFAFGSAGEADALVWAGVRFQRPELHRVALQRMAAATERTLHGVPQLLGGTLGNGLRIPGLLHGSAGIGYVMLRLAMPDRLPALAVFDLPVPLKVL